MQLVIRQIQKREYSEYTSDKIIQNVHSIQPIHGATPVEEIFLKPWENNKFPTQCIRKGAHIKIQSIQSNSNQSILALNPRHKDFNSEVPSTFLNVK